MRASDRVTIKKKFESFIESVRGEQKVSRQVIEELALLDAESKSPEQASLIIFKVSILDLIIDLCWLTIGQAEYCDYYIDKNEGCHKDNLEEFRKARKDIEADISKIALDLKPFLDAKNNVSGFNNVMGYVKKGTVKLTEWAALIAIFNMLDFAPK